MDRLLKIISVLFGAFIGTVGFYWIGHWLDIWGINPHVSPAPYTNLPYQQFVVQYWFAGFSSTVVIVGGLILALGIIILVKYLIEWLYPKKDDDNKTEVS
jgi:hypothetical protein